MRKMFPGSALLCSALFFMHVCAAAEVKMEKAVFAGGCFWCMETSFDKLDGVKEVASGYTGGRGANPTYDDYAEKGYLEAIQVIYDPAKISYSKLLDAFWRQIDPTDPGGQFADRGPQYRTAIFYESDEQKRLAEKSREALARSGRFKKPIVTEILKAGPFHKAEEYHQCYYKKSPAKYEFYRSNSGRDQFLKKTWGDPKETAPAAGGAAGSGKPGKEALRSKLTPLQYKVTQENGTEAPFRNEYWDNEKEGLYVDIVSGEPLFSSRDKFDSGCGWPSFSKPIASGAVAEREDRSLFSSRTEVRSSRADSHLGHVFNDGPLPTGLRYCINSAALRFIPKADLEKEGYGAYKSLFEK